MAEHTTRGAMATQGDGDRTAAPAEATTPVTPDTMAARRGPARSLLRSPVLAWAVTVLAVAAAVWFALQVRDLQARETARTEARQAAEVAALQLTTFTGAGIDEWVEQTRTLATGEFARDLAQQYDQKLRADLRELDVESVGEVISSFVQSIEQDEAMVFTVLRQTTRYPTFEQTVEDEVRFEISLQRTNGEWLVSDAQLLSPTPAIRPRPFLEDNTGDGG